MKSLEPEISGYVKKTVNRRNCRECGGLTKNYFKCGACWNKSPEGKDELLGISALVQKVDLQKLGLPKLNFCATSFAKSNGHKKLGTGKGYHYVQSRKKYHASIMFEGKRTSLGYYDTSSEAQKAYDTGFQKIVRKKEGKT